MRCSVVFGVTLKLLVINISSSSPAIPAMCHNLRDGTVKVKVDSATSLSQTRDQQRFAISEVAADWHEPVVPQRIMWPSIARANRQLHPRCS